MISLARQNNARVLLVGIHMPANYGRAYTERFTGMYKDLSTNMKVPLVPYMLQGVELVPTNFQADRLHPAATAHPVILNNIWPQLAPLIKE
jgi:acyl-CoA thioesterase-1